MLLGFKRQFVPFVLDGSKTHTIRGERKHPPVVGQRCDCYVDARQRTMRLLGRWRCVKVERIEIHEDGFHGGFQIFIEGIRLDPHERNELAWRDGFRGVAKSHAFELMMRFWMKTHDRTQRSKPVTEPFVFSGHIIHWDQRQPMVGPRRTSPQAQTADARKQSTSHPEAKGIE